MNATDPVWDVIIIGAGMSGLSARRTFVEHGMSCLTLEKSRGLGGRASTRRAGKVCADLGAQFTSAKTEYWRDLLQASGAVGVKPIFLQTDSLHPRYVHAEGMSRLASLLVTDLSDSQRPIRKETRVTKIEPSGKFPFWEILDHHQQTHRALGLVVTLPVPQALELFDHSGLSSKLDTDPSQRDRLNQIKYSRCISVAYVLNEETSLPQPGILKNPSSEISGIFDQAKKGLNTSEPTVVVQAGPELSLKLWEEPTETQLETIWRKALDATGGQVFQKGFKAGWPQKWKYCEPLQQMDPKFERVLTKWPSPLVLAGDAFGGAKIEGAIISGREAALAVTRLLLPRTQPLNNCFTGTLD